MYLQGRLQKCHSVALAIFGGKAVDFYLIPKIPLCRPRSSSGNLRLSSQLVSLLDEKGHFLPAPQHYFSKQVKQKSLLKSKYAQKGWKSAKAQKNLIHHIGGTDQNPKLPHPLRFTYHECISWLLLFIHNANWHELVFSKQRMEHI